MAQSNRAKKTTAKAAAEHRERSTPPAVEPVVEEPSTQETGEEGPQIEPVTDVDTPTIEPPKPATTTVDLTVPIDLACDLIVGRHFEILLTPSQAVTLNGVRAALDAGHCRMGDGRVVHTNGDAVRWLLEQIGTAAAG